MIILLFFTLFLFFDKTELKAQCTCTSWNLSNGGSFTTGHQKKCVPLGTTVTVASLNVDNYNELCVLGTLVVTVGITINGGKGKILNHGKVITNTLVINGGMSKTDSSVFHNYDTLIIKSTAANGLNVTGASAFFNSGYVKGYGGINVSGGANWFYNTGTIEVEKIQEFSGGSVLTNYGSLKTLNGGIDAYSGGSKMNNFGTIDLNGDIKNMSGGSKINNNGFLHVNGGFYGASGGSSVSNNCRLEWDCSRLGGNSNDAFPNNGYYFNTGCIYCKTGTCHLPAGQKCLPPNTVQITATPSDAACLPYADSITLTAPYFANYKYVWSHDNSIDTNVVKVKPSDTTTFKLNIIGCCDKTAEITIFINKPPIADAGIDTAICPYDSATLHASGGMFYKWNTNDDNAVIKVQPQTDTWYFVSVSNGYNCETKDSVKVLLKTIPVVKFNKPMDLCIDAPPMALTTGNHMPEGTYFGQGVTNNTFDPKATGSGTFLLHYLFQDATTLCKDTDTASVTVYPLPVVDLGKDFAICKDSCVNLKPLVSQGVMNYKWNTGETLTNIKVCPDSSRQYIVTITNATTTTKCSNKDSVFIAVNPLPVASFIPDKLKGCEPQQILFTDNTKNPDAAYWEWNFGDNTALDANQNPTHIFHKDGTYTVSLNVKTLAGCTDDTVMKNLITVYPRPTAIFIYSPLNPTNFSPEVEFKDFSTGAIQNWLWNFDDIDSGNDNASSIQNPDHSYSSAGAYQIKLTVETQEGCKDDTTITVHVKAEFTFYAPNAFTPNDDGVNDFFEPKGAGINENTFKLLVFSRWGEEIFKSDGMDKLWDGNAFGKPCPAGVYAWLIVFKDLEGKSHQYKGLVDLIR